MSRELWLCHTQLGLEPADIARIIISGFKAAFLPFHIKQVYLRRVASELARFMQAPLSVLDPEAKPAEPEAPPQRPSQRVRH